MKFVAKLSPKRLFRSKKDRSTVSRSDPPSFSSGTTSSSYSDISTNLKRKSAAAADSGTPTSILPGDWSDDVDFEVSRSQLEALLCRIGADPPSQEEISTILGEIEGNGNGCISLDALMNRVAGSICEPAGEPELRETFDVFDSDRDGRITAEELMSFFTAMGDEGCTLEDCRRMIAGVDKNGDGFVCFEDFAKMMELQMQQQKLNNFTFFL